MPRRRDRTACGEAELRRIGKGTTGKAILPRDEISIEPRARRRSGARPGFEGEAKPIAPHHQ